MTGGLFITLEGGDGVGKSTQAALLEEWLTGRGRTVVRTREPGGTEVGVEIREIVLHHRGDIAPRAEALLYAADRAHHIATVVRPALERGEVVVQDRYLDSSVAYQGAGRVLDAQQIRDLSLWAAEGLLPDLTILLDLDEDAARARLDASRTRYDRLEAERSDFHARVRAGYLGLAEAEPERFLVVDAGFSFTHVVPLVGGHRVAPATRRSDPCSCALLTKAAMVMVRVNVGGKVLTNYLKEIVSYRYWNMMEETYIVNHVKQTCCFVAHDFVRQLDEARCDVDDEGRGLVDPADHQAGGSGGGDGGGCSLGPHGAAQPEAGQGEGRRRKFFHSFMRRR